MLPPLHWRESSRIAYQNSVKSEMMDSRHHELGVVIAGAQGQLGWELQQLAFGDGVHLDALSHERLDVTDRVQVYDAVTELQPAILINTAAYTAVDRAEAERDLAYRVNADGAANLASAAQEVGAKYIHLSTDFVFDGKKSSPYTPQDKPNPINVYGASKLEGERRALEITEGDALIFRTAWVYSSHGHNFVKTMLRLLREREEIGVVADQIGTPTWARGLAKVVRRALSHKQLSGCYHWTDAGVASWYDFAVAIQEEALVLGMLPKVRRIIPIPSHAYPLPAARPAYSVMDKTVTWSALNIDSVHWRESLRGMLRQLHT